MVLGETLEPVLSDRRGYPSRSACWFPATSAQVGAVTQRRRLREPAVRSERFAWWCVGQSARPSARVPGRWHTE